MKTESTEFFDGLNVELKKEESRMLLTEQLDVLFTEVRSTGGRALQKWTC